MALPTVQWLAGLQGFQINDVSGSGLGSYGAAGFGASVKVGAWQGRTFVCDSTGAVQGPETNNVQYVNAASAILGQSGSGVALTAVPNAQATLNARFLNSVACKTQNCTITAYDRSNPDNAPSGVTIGIAEFVHPNPVQGNSGSGSTQWQFPTGTGVMNITASPGTSGLRPNGPNTTDTQHDWYFGITQSPVAVGSKTAGVYLYLEYL